MSLIDSCGISGRASHDCVVQKSKISNEQCPDNG